MSNKSIMTTIGASNFALNERQKEDFYATDPVAIDRLENAIEIPHLVWECACGQGHLSERLKKYGHKVFSSDLFDRGYGVPNVDFFQVKSLNSILDFEISEPNNFCILTNPPFKYAADFVLHGLDILPIGSYLILFLKTVFLEGKRRYENIFSKVPPRYVFQFIERVDTARNADFNGLRQTGGSAVSYAWFVWQKMSAKEKYDTIIDWI